jgi:hypothetical protein
MLRVLRLKLELPLLFSAMVQMMCSILHRHLHDAAQVSVYFRNTLDFIIHDLQELDSVDATPQSQRTLTSPSALNIQPRHKPIPYFLTRSLLNLKPHSDRDSDHEGTPLSSQKKKRKRRRKKKNALISSATDSKVEETINDIEC